MYEVKVETHFSAAHHLLNYKGECENQHGHNWKVEVFVQGDNLDEANILVDFKVLKKFVNETVSYLDHVDINTLPEFEGISPSSEIIAKFLFDRVKAEYPGTSRVSVYETPNSCATYFEE